MRLDAQQPWRIRKHRARVGLGESFAVEQVEKHFGVTTGHVGVGFNPSTTLRAAPIIVERGERESKVPPSVDHLFWGARG